ncbi:MAG TPA: elongation factor P [Gemmataceae bacterium]|jgi:elongation factor P|nr:elongation factor P [Gemmataceae bacterium]
MITAGQFKKGAVITLEGGHWIIEDYHIQKTAQRKPVIQTRLRNMKTGHVVERGFDEADRFEQPELQSRPHQFLYRDRSDYVFMDTETFEQVTVPEEIVGNGKWLLKEGEEFVIRLIDGRPAQILFPPNFVDEVVETAEPAGHSSNVLKDAKLACGLVVKVPLFIRTGERIKVDTETHKYLGKESARH